jgi:PIN domain nuclease of toxin-antitoxin system
VSGLLLDTHAWLWYAEGVANCIGPAARATIETARRQHRLHVSSISVWEIGMLCAKGKIALSAPVKGWLRRALAAPGLRLLDLDAETALESTQLPGSPHGDPADRFLIAVARVHDLTLATADTKIIDYAAAGHLRVLAL